MIISKKKKKDFTRNIKKKVAALKKTKKQNDSVGQIFTKGLLPIYVLYILSLGPTNGNEISHKIGLKTNGKWIPSTGGIYPLLKRLESDELIVGTWDDPSKRFQKIYHFTAKGLIEFNNKKSILKPKLEQSMEVFNIIYSDLYIN